jgi:mannose-6-phosphate isomerase
MCTIGDETFVAGPGESVDVPIGAKHRLANEGTEELVIVEIQHGAYTGEDDIVRLDDDYGR